jgi:hypothetical protein
MEKVSSYNPASLAFIQRPTMRAPDVWDSAAFSSIFLASSFSCSQTESTPAPAPVTQTVGRTRANCFRRSISNIQELQIITPPDYLEGKVILSSKSSPTNLLQDGQWCGHGEPKYSVFDVPVGSENSFSLQ